jgi:hypothetical protein
MLESGPTIVAFGEKEKRPDTTPASSTTLLNFSLESLLPTTIE